MNQLELLKRVHQIEAEVADLKATLEPPRERQLSSRVAHFLKTVLAYWVLGSFLMALATAAYVKFRFDVDPFENYRNIRATRDLSEFYRGLGDRMLLNTEWKAAEEAYASALRINSNDKEATYGLMKAQMFQPREGENRIAAESVSLKLDYLSSRLKDDPYVAYMKGTYFDYIGKPDSASFYFTKSTANSSFAGGYIGLGLLAQQEGDLTAAVLHYEKAIGVDPNFAIVNNNLGFCHLVLSHFKEAVKYLERANELMPGKVLTTLNLGDAYRYDGKPEAALAVHLISSSLISQPDSLLDARMLDEWWLYSYMPLREDDRETIKFAEVVSTLDAKRAFVHYAVSFDYALLGNLEQATTEFDIAFNEDDEGKHRTFFAFRIVSILNILKPSEEARRWFLERLMQLDAEPDPREWLIGI